MRTQASSGLAVRLRLAGGVLLVLSLTASATAQVIARPERPVAGVFGGGRPPDPGRPRQDLVLSLSTLGGYDDHLSPTGDGFDVFAPREPGYTGFADAALAYRRGRDVQSIELGGRAFVNAFRNAGLGPAYGGDVRGRLIAPVGRRMQLQLSEDIRNRPFYGLAPFGPLQSAVTSDFLPDVGSANGFSLRRSTESDSAAALMNRWKGGSTLRGTYRYQTQDFLDDLGDGHSHLATVDYVGVQGRSSNILASYRYSTSAYLELEGLVRPLEDHSADVGYRYERNMTRTRRWSMSFGAGAAYVDTLNGVTRERFTYATPSGYGNLRLDIARTWSAWADYRRAVSVLHGLSPEPFTTDNALVRVGGFVGRRSEVAVSAAFSEGRQVLGDATGQYRTYTGTAQLRLFLTGIWSAVIIHNFYHHTLRGVNALPGGFPERLNRNAFQVGMAFDLPLYGAYIRQRERPVTGN